MRGHRPRISLRFIRATEYLRNITMPSLLARAFAKLWKKLNNALPPPPGLPPPPQAQTTRIPDVSTNPLAGLPLDYLIGADNPGPGKDGRITEAGYDCAASRAHGISIKYCNLFDEKNSKRYGPYLNSSDTARRYAEGQIDPKGDGWQRNLREQFARAKAQGFLYIELDNPDAYSVMNVIGAIDLAQEYALRVIAKNPLACEWNPVSYIAHSNVYGVIVERGAGSPADMDKLRKNAGKPDLPVWFVAFRKGSEDGRPWAGNAANAARAFKNVGVTFSPDGEYTSVEDILLPNAGSMPKPTPVTPAPARCAQSGQGFADRIVTAMKARNYPLAVGPDVVNVVYIEGCEPDGTPNANRPNAFDSVRIVVRVLPGMKTGVNALLPADGSAKIIGIWDAITHAGMYWEVHRMNPAGAFHIALGPQTCWVMGHYHDMEALIQAAPITGTRDANNDFKRSGPTVRGDFGVHHHWGYNYPKDDAGKSSAGCQVGHTEAGHRQFIALLKTDARYRADHRCMWSSTVMPVEWLLTS